MPARRVFLPALLIGLIAALTNAADTAPGAVEIVASKRAFAPETVTLRAGRPAILTIRNEDDDLHAFVPLLLFQKILVVLSLRCSHRQPRLRVGSLLLQMFESGW